MDNPTNIDHLIRDKFENFEPAPPQHIWAGVQAGIATQATPGFFAVHGRKIAVAALILLLISVGVWMILPSGGSSDDIDELTRISETDNSQNAGIAATDQDDANTSNSDTQLENNSTGESEIKDDSNELISSELETPSPAKTNETTQNTEVADKDLILIISDNEESNASVYYPEINYLRFAYAINGLNSLDGELKNDADESLVEKQFVESPPQINIPKDKPSIDNRWSHGIYFSPEIILNDFDSVRILPSYSLNYEPTYRFNKHWFMRFGVGLTYGRERGFSKLDYKSKEVVGTYEDVYDVTFDTIDNVVVPTFHTKTTEVWDSINHVQVTEVTNQYLYLQTPVLFGYYNNSKKFNWYFYGGPALNVMISKWIEKPEEDLVNAKIVNLENNLPNRSPYYLQLWVGAGIEYKVGKQLALALEPNYRYHLKQIYDDPRMNTSLSGFSLRIGVVFKIK